MENGSAVVKPLVTRTPDGIEDDTFVKRLEEGVPVAEESISGTEKVPLVRRRAPVVQRRAPCCVVGHRHPGVGLLVWSRAP